MIRFAYRVAISACAVLLVCGTARAVTSASAPSVTVPQLSAPPHVSGVIDASWKGAARFNLGYDFVYHRPAKERTTVYIAECAHALYVAWDVHQKEPVTAEQTTNGGGVFNDDHVAIAFYPQGTHGFTYIFRANANGARDQSSSENSAYAPQWTAAGHRTPYGYEVTERIPLNIMRTGGSTTWRAQFVRPVVATGSRYVWAYNPAMQYDIDVNYIGTLKGITVGKSGARPPARVQIYGLGEMAARSMGGDTSRIGADLSLPVTPTASFVATLHPDYSNVEIDQQSIAPQEFPRFYQEVRPFFTQIGSDFNYHFGCWNCPTTLYTPTIPEFSQGYAVEGTQGPATFAAFDAIGSQRTDAGQTVNIAQTAPNHQVQLDLQRVSVDTPDLHDVTDTLASGYSFSHNHAMVFMNAGTDRGTLVTDPSRGNYREYGFALVTPTENVGVDYQQVGPQFQPVDGYVNHPGISGLIFNAGKTYNYSGTAALQQLSLNVWVDAYDGPDGRMNQSDQNVNAFLKTRSQFSFGASTGSSYLRVADGEMLPFTQNSLNLSYRGNTDTPTYVDYGFGRYYHGFLDTWTRGTTLRLARPLLLSLEADNTHYVPDPQYGPGTPWNEIGADQLLERVSLDWQFNHAAQLDIGARRISGIFAPTGFGYVPVTGTPPIDATNLTAAFHFLALRNEFYVVYGDPSRLSTAHALYFKWIRYIGAPKGT